MADRARLRSGSAGATVGRVSSELVPEVVRNKALASGAVGWLEALPELVGEIERDWSIRVGPSYTGGTDAFVARATRGDGTTAVLKLVIPRGGDDVHNEILALRLANGEGCVRLLRDDEARGALLLERLGASMAEQGLPLVLRHELLCRAAEQMWRPAPDCGLPTGAEKGRWLVDFIATQWDTLDRPCSERTIDLALACAHRRIAAHDDERAVLAHGDVHQWNALATSRDREFKLIDPDGLLAEAEYDMGILMREDPAELLTEEPRDRAAWLARRTGLDAAAIWEWGAVERVSTGLLCTRIGLQPAGRQMLEVADRAIRP